jgi:aldehyde dehydrogenase (NAD+)
VAEAFVAEAKAALIALYGKDPKANPDYSRMIGAREVSRLAALIDPAKVVIGGQSDPAARYLDPTIIYPVSWADRIMEDEIFGPILPILTYRTLDEAFGRISVAPRPLAAFVFSRSQSAIDRFTGKLSFGGWRSVKTYEPVMSKLARCSPFFSYMVILPAPWVDTASAALNRKSSAWVAL